MSPRTKRAGIVVASALALAGCAGGAFGWQACAVGAGYSAQILCSSVFVSGRDVEEVVRDDLAHIPWLSVEVDRAGQAAIARVGPVERRAVYRPGLGSVLAVGEGAVVEAKAETAPVASSAFAWADAAPQTSADLEAAVGAAFAEPDPAAPVRTRAVVVVHEGALLAERYAPGFERDTPLMGWSMTKSVLNGLIGALVQQGKLKVEDPAGLPEWSGDERSSITVDQLLRMSSGLSFDESYFSPTADVVSMLFRSGDVGGYAASLPLEHAPDTHWSYSSGTSNILSRIARRTVGDDAAYWALPGEALFGPLGMRSAVLETDARGTFVASSLMYATARDWARFGLLYLNDGVWGGRRILPEGWVDYTRAPTPRAPKGRYGAHWWLNAGSEQDPQDRPWPSLPTDLYRASGFQGQSVTVVPSRKAVIVRLGCATPPASFDYEGFVAGVLAALPN